ncbi:hypothetical protein CYMTET_43819 [Cymbomonas tetramitiformis]|uniref:Protein Abitram n=1 Tax=Cymbomonas tetramitiformis TaxID=36881 RepID=A0AAE0EZX5_9CHLO|nr:hypothetical protein CYMTET_43819 [Cymbomonas tetramitiformis]
MPLPSRPTSHVELDYTQHFAIDLPGEPKCDQVLHRHPNGLSVVCLAASHPLLQAKLDGSSELKVDFNVGRKNRLDTQVSGKKKRNASVLEKDSVLCEVTAPGDKKYAIRCCVRGKLLEVNERLVQEPHLLLQQPWSDGFVAVMMPESRQDKEMQENLISMDAYKKLRGDGGETSEEVVGVEP